MAADWQKRLDEGVVGSRASLAREMGVSRARVTQVLSCRADEDPDNAMRADFQPGDLELLALV